MEFSGNKTMEKNASHIRVFSHALILVASFSLVFIVGWGGAATLAQQQFPLS